MPGLADLIPPLLDRPSITPEETHALSTGLASLDAVAEGGFYRGQVWLLYSAPGSGRTSLVAQWARAVAAQTDATVLLALGAADPHEALARLLAAEAKVALLPILTGALSEADVARLIQARPALEGLMLDIVDARSLNSELSRQLAPTPQRRMVIVDDVHLIGSDVPALLSGWRACALPHGSTLVVSATQEAVLRFGVLRPEWARFVDVAVQLTAPSAFGETVGRLNLSHLKWCRQHQVDLVPQLHYGRFREPPNQV